MDYEKELAHYGIKGMRWGIRKRKPRPVSSDRARVNELKKKSTRTLTNDELRDLNTRLQLERTYNDLLKTDRTVGQKILNNIMDAMIKQATTTLVNYSKKELENRLKKLGK